MPSPRPPGAGTQRWGGGECPHHLRGPGGGGTGGLGAARPPESLPGPPGGGVARRVTAARMTPSRRALAVRASLSPHWGPRADGRARTDGPGVPPDPPPPFPLGGDAKFWGSCAPTLLGEHQGVFPPRLGDDGAVFHLTIPRARAGWAGGRAGGRAGGLGWGAWAGARRAPAPETPTPAAVHIPPRVSSPGREGRRPAQRAGGPGGGSPGAPSPDPPVAAPGSSVWVQHGESGAKTRGGNGTRGGFQAPPSPPYSR